MYKARKMIEEELDRIVPRLGWKTQYSRVSFGNERYSVVKARSQRQAIVLTWVARFLGIGIVGLLLLCVKRVAVERLVRPSKGSFDTEV